MKIEKLSNPKIKIELSENEITSWNNIANTRIPDYNAMMVDLISAVEKETGISFRGSHVVVEATREPGGKYVVFVSREGKQPAHRLLKNKVMHSKEVSHCRVVAEFENIESILMFDNHFPFYANMLKGSNTLYSYNGYYYLDITLPGNFSGYTDSLRGNLSEFSTLTGGTVIPYLLPEHGKCLIEKNALLLLRKMNCGVFYV